MVSEDTWRQHMNDCGQIEDDFRLRKVTLFTILLLLEWYVPCCVGMLVVQNAVYDGGCNKMFIKLLSITSLPLF